MELGLVIGFSFCVLILLLILRFTSLHWLYKSGLTVLALGAVYAFYLGLHNSLGWPIAYKPTCVMLVEWVDIREPSGQSPGDIFIWFIDTDESIKNKKLSTPRAIRLPYTKEDHIKLTKALGLLSQGEPVYMSLNDDGESSLAMPLSDNREFARGRMNFVPPPKTATPKQSSPDDEK